MIRKSIVLCLALVPLLAMLSSSVYAGCDSTRCVGKINRLYISGSYLYISTDGNEANLDCTSPDDVYVTIPTSDPDFDKKYALVLTGMSLDKNIGLRIVGGSATCALSYVYVDN